jgi:GT2 family glycosyltransferase
MPNSFEPSAKKVTIVIPNWNGAPWLPQCLAALGRQDMRDFDTLLVDNGSSDKSVELVRNNYPDVKVIALPHNTGFAHAANLGIAQTATPYVALLSADTEPSGLAVLEAIESAPAQIGATASQMLQMDAPDRLDDAGDALSWYGAADKNKTAHPTKEHPNGKNSCLQAKARLDQGTDRRKIGNG